MRKMTHAMSLGVFIAFKGTNFCSLFATTAAGVVPCGGPKKSPRTSFIMQNIFYFWSCEISETILKVKCMQGPGTESIRTQIQPSKSKLEISKITNSQYTKRTYVWSTE